MSADKYPSISSRQMAAIVYIIFMTKHGLLFGNRSLIATADQS